MRYDNGDNEDNVREDRGKNITSTNIVQRSMKAKLVVMGLAMVIAFVGLGGRVAHLQSVYGDEFTRRVIVQQVMDSPGSERIITPNRGAIVDRNNNMQALAISHTVYNVFIDPYRILGLSHDAQEEIFDHINLVLGIPISELREILSNHPNSRYRVIARRVNLTTKEALEGLGARHVYFEEDTQRLYPGGNIAASLIGFIRGDSTWGLEQRFNEELSGIPGRELRILDENNNAVAQLIPPIEGHTIVTTLDLLIQQEAQRLVAHYGSTHRARNASLIMMDVHTGEIIAMAEYPSFDLNDPFNVERINSETTRNRIMAEPEDRWLELMFEITRNFSVSDTFEPGSSFKPLVYAAALEEGVISVNDMFYCGGGRQIHYVWVQCWNGTNCGYQTLTQAIANSCNPAVMDAARRLGRDRYYRYQRDFGIGRPTGIDIGGEPNTAHLVHNRASLNDVELAVAGMGQGFNVTTMQMVTSFASLVNGGYLMQPFVVSQMIDAHGEVVFAAEPTVARKVISNETSEIMRLAMIDAIEWGTGRRAGIPGYLIGGKTGTAQQGDKDDPYNTDEVQTLITYFPADNPQYVVMAVISLPEIVEFGNSQTSPMVRSLMNFVITHRQIEANDRDAFNRVLIDDTMHTPDYIGRSIAEVTSSLNALGFIYDISGSGDIVRGQFPSPGSRVNRGSMIHLTIESSSDDIELHMIPNVVGLHYTQAMQIIESAGLVPIIRQGMSAPVMDEDDDEYGYEQPVSQAGVQVVSSQFPRNEVRVQAGTQILIFVE